MVSSLMRTFGLAAIIAATAVVPSQAQQPPTTAELFAVPGVSSGGPSLVTDENLVRPLLVPIQALRPGEGASSTTMISQLGEGNFAAVGTVGTNNFAGVAQSGSNNRAVQAIHGTGSAMLLVQSGTGNNVVQSAIGNNNTQLLGVTGTNNDVAYLQVGNNLGGVMSVGGENSAVVALQTPGSSNYMMPSGLRGLQNQIVVVVPGRMYVFPRN